MRKWYTIEDLEMLDKIKGLFSMERFPFDKNSVAIYFNGHCIGEIENDEYDDDNLIMIKRWLEK